MGEHEFDVDASILAGWARFSAHLAGLVRELTPGDTFDLAIPVAGRVDAGSPAVRFTGIPGPGVVVEIAGDSTIGPGRRLGEARREQLRVLGWADPDHGGDLTLHGTPEDADRLGSVVGRTLETVFGVPHPAFLSDAGGTGAAAGDPPPDRTQADDPDFVPFVISTPDEATRAVGTALAEVYARDMPADEHDVFAVPAGSALLFVRAHRSLPLVVFRCPLVSAVTDAGAAEREVAILNRDSLWCRYVFDGETIYAESELVDRVFVPVNFKIRLTEVATEIDDVDDDLARRVDGKRWLDLRGADEGSHEEP